MPEPKASIVGLKRSNRHGIKRSDFLRLDMNEGLIGLPEHFVNKVLSEITPDKLSMYPEYEELIASIAEHEGLSSENIVLTNGSDAAIKNIFETYISPGDRVLLTDPTFAMYAVYCEMFGAEATVVDYSDFVFPYAEFIEKLQSGVKLAVIVNPHNPTGTIVDTSLMEKIINLAEQKDVLLIVDEAYYYYGSYTVMPCIKNYKNLIVIRTFSKMLSMAATRLGYLGCSERCAKAIRNTQPTYDVNALAVLFATKLLSNKEEIFDELLIYFQASVRSIVEWSKDENIDIKLGYGNFVLIDCKGYEKEIVKILHEKNILVNGGFKQSFLQNYIRVTIAKEKEMSHFLNSFLFGLKYLGIRN